MGINVVNRIVLSFAVRIGRVSVGSEISVVNPLRRIRGGLSKVKLRLSGLVGRKERRRSEQSSTEAVVSFPDLDLI